MNVITTFSHTLLALKVFQLIGHLFHYGVEILKRDDSGVSFTEVRL